MISQEEVNKLIQKTRKYEFSDGLRDIQLAVLFGFGGVASWLVFQPFWILIIDYMVKKFGRWAAWIGILPTFLAVLAVWGMLGLMNKLRRNWLWRESGIVKPSRWVVPRRINFISAVIMISSVALSYGFHLFGIANDVFVLRMIWVATGWGFGYTMFAMGLHLDLHRYLWLGAVGGLISTVMLFLPLNFSQTSLIFGLIWFVVLMISGIVTLRNTALANIRDQ